MAERTGVFGGTFDPIHRGHLDVARWSMEALGLDRVLFVPARVPPHRPIQPRASACHRFAMVALATQHDDGYVACDIELESPGPSYTVTTLALLLQAGHPAGTLCFIAGADAFAEIATWKDYPAILDRCHYAVVSRPGYPVHDLRRRLPDLASRMRDVLLSAPEAERRALVDEPAPAIFLVGADTADVSSSAVRRLAARRERLSHLVLPEVDNYIRRHGLYAGGPVAADDLHDQG